MMMVVRRPPIVTFALIGFAFVVAVILLYSTARHRYSGRGTSTPYTGSKVHTDPNDPVNDAGNATLGFTKILALSSGTTWRTHGLAAAANLTDLQIDIPAHPNAPDEMVSAFVDIGPPQATHPNKGAARAWLAHLDLIRYFIASNLDTVLIIEDDVDWDVAIKDQMKLIATNVRLFTNVSSEEDSTAPYGRNWDVLWVGHCGEMLHNTTERLEYPDDTGHTSWSNYAGWSKFSMHHIQEGHRAIQHSIMPVCTFGYALNKLTAEKVLQRASRGQDEAFDVVLNHACGSGQLNCISVNPEVMHHYVPPEGHSGSSSDVERANENSDGATGQKEEGEEEGQVGTTANIIHSARCAALFNTTCLTPPTPDSWNAGADR